MKRILLLFLLISIQNMGFSISHINPHEFNGVSLSVPVDSKNSSEIAMSDGHNNHNHNKKMMKKNMGRMNAPMGVMGIHKPKKGHFMFSYRYMYMSMKGDLLRGSTKVELSEATEYMMLPKEMEVHMHMFGMMYSPIDKLSVMVMVPYVEKRMVMQMRMNPSTERTTEASGLGDMKIMGLYELYSSGVHSFNLGLGLGLPTGDISINNWNNTQHGGYNMQLGSGSFELIPSISYIGSLNKLGWGVDFKTIFRLDKNAADYRLGNRYSGNIWGGYRVLSWVALALRINIDHQENISGQDKYHTSTTMSPGMDPDAYGWSRINGLAGLNFYLPLGALHNKIGIEGGVPLYQSNQGVKRGVDWMLTAGISLGYKF